LVPCVVKPPVDRFLPSASPGGFNRSFATVMDFVPTFLEMAGISMPTAAMKKRIMPSENCTATSMMTTFRGRDVHSVRGKSWIPFFARGEKVEHDETWAIHSSSEPVGWELFARGALRRGDWKIVHFSKERGGTGVGDEGWELFNVARDPGETKDLAQAEPQKLQELLECWNEYVIECGIVWGNAALDPGLSKDEAPEFWQDEIDLQKCWMGARGGECPVPCR
jgi:arylsulfatase A-like enzyme